MSESLDQIIGLFNQGQLAEALEAGKRLVTEKPMDLAGRLVLAQLTCYTGDWERVEQILQQVRTLDRQADNLLLVSTISQLATAEQTRQDVWQRGAVPGFLSEPTQLDKKTLWAASCFREGAFDRMREALDYIDQHRASLRVELDDVVYSDLRDMNDLSATFLEAHSASGEYYWIPLDAIKKIDISSPHRPMDFYWHPARLTIGDKAAMMFYLPGLYPGSHESDDANLQLGRESSFETDDHGLTRGLGRKVFQMGDGFEGELFEFKSMTIEVTDGKTASVE